jgi:AbrB family looped-hinge helix DNA binding protein
MTLPKDIRDKLRLKPGDKVEIVALPDGSVRLFPTNRPIAALRGMLPRPARTVTVREMNEGIAEAVAEKYRRR